LESILAGYDISTPSYGGTFNFNYLAGSDFEIIMTKTATTITTEPDPGHIPFLIYHVPEAIV
jgi:hypothetical protein